MTRSASAVQTQPDPFLAWEGNDAQWIISICKCVDYWSPRGRTCLVELDTLTSKRAKTKGYGDAIMKAIDSLVKRKIIEYESGVITIPKIFKPEIAGKLTRNRPPE